MSLPTSKAPAINAGALLICASQAAPVDGTQEVHKGQCWASGVCAFSSIWILQTAIQLPVTYRPPVVQEGSSLSRRAQGSRNR